jgi:hypothetical protein
MILTEFLQKALGHPKKVKSERTDGLSAKFGF